MRSAQFSTHEEHPMKVASHIIASVIAATFAGTALAQEATPDTWMNTSASKSRAQVQDELQQARIDGTIRFTSEGYDFVARSASPKSREQVRAELNASKESGEFDVLNAEAHSFGTVRIPMYAGSGLK
jgi:hypothetical protein